MSNSLFKSLSKAEQYVNTINPKLSCEVATTANLTLSGEQTIDSVSVTAGNRVLVKNQNNGYENGIYVCSTGQWSRSTDMNSNETCVPNSFVFIEKGTYHGDKLFQLTTNNIVLNTTNLLFSEYGDILGLDVKESCRIATTGNISLSGTQTIDGVGVVAGNRVLVKDQSTGSQNGIYLVQSGGWTRASDFDSDNEVSGGAFTFIEAGALNADAGFVLTTNDSITIGSTAIAFTQFSGAGQITAGDGLEKSGNTLSVDAKSNSGIVIETAKLSLNLGATGITGTLAIGDGGTGATSAGSARTALGVDAAGTDNSTNVTLANTNYLSISGQEVTGGTVPVGSGGTGATTLDNLITLGNHTTGNYVASLTAGTLIDLQNNSGEGASPTIDVDLSEASEAAIVNGDYILFLDGGATGTAAKESLADLATLFAGSGLTTANSVLNVIGGDGITANENDMAITSAQTTITSILNTALVVGRDADNQVKFSTDDEMIFRLNGTDEIKMAANLLAPVTSDGAALGNTSLMWSDLFLESGSVINFNNGDITLTHALNKLTFAGGHLEMAGNILPSADNTYDLGNASFLWRDIYVSSGSIFVGATKFSIDGDGDLELSDKDNASTKRKVKLPNSSVTNDMLAGSIANGKLAGSIANGKLANSSITIDGSAISLGGSVTTNNTMGSGFVLEDGDGTEVTITEGKEVKFVEGEGIDINWTDTNNGTDGDPYDLTISCDLEGTELKSTGESGGSKFLREDGDGTCSWQTPTDTNTQLSTEQVQDIAGPLVATAGTKTGISITYDDANNNMDFVVSDTTVAGDSGSTAITPGDTLTIAGGTNVTTSMSGDTLTIAATDTNTTYSGGNGLGLDSTTFSITPAQTAITSVINASLVVGRDADNQIKFGTDNQITFEVGGGDNVIFKASGEIEATSLDISGDVDIDGTLEADAITVNGTAFSEVISDTVGAMFSSNTETGITVTYQDADNTIDLAVGTLNQNTTGSAATLTTARTIGGVSFNGAANINLPGVNSGGNQNTSGSSGSSGSCTGNAATATLATNITASANNSTSETTYLTFVDGATGTQGIETDTGLTYNPSSGVLTTTGLVHAPGLALYRKVISTSYATQTYSTSYIEIPTELRIKYTAQRTIITCCLIMGRLRPNNRVMYYEIYDWNSGSAYYGHTNKGFLYANGPQMPVKIMHTLTGLTIGQAYHLTFRIKASGYPAYWYRDGAYQDTTHWIEEHVPGVSEEHGLHYNTGYE